MPSSKKAINFCSMKYHLLLSEKFAYILNNNNNYVRITFKTYNSSIKTINNIFVNKLFINFNSYDAYITI